jgi:hypothetical protein
VATLVATTLAKRVLERSVAPERRG